MFFFVFVCFVLFFLIIMGAWGKGLFDCFEKPMSYLGQIF